jgi:hypothetical protein
MGLPGRSNSDQQFDDHVVLALIPTSCPELNRSRWTGSDLSLSWVGLLQAVNGCYDYVMRSWLEMDAAAVVAIEGAGGPLPLALDDGDDAEPDAAGSVFHDAQFQDRKFFIQWFLIFYITHYSLLTTPLFCLLVVFAIVLDTLLGVLS